MASFAAWLEDNQFNDPYRVYDYFFDQIKDAAAVVGIDLQPHDLDVSRSSKVKKLTPLSKKDKGKIVAYVELQKKSFKHGDSLKSFLLPYFNFFTNKGDVTSPFSTYNALWSAFKQATPINFSDKPKSILPAKKAVIPPEFESVQWKANQVKRWGDEYAAASLDVIDSYYLQRKFKRLDVDALAVAAVASAKAGVRFGHDSHGHFLITRLQHANGAVVGYQKIYDLAIEFNDGSVRDKDQRFLEASKNGSFLRIGSTAKHDDYVFIAEGFATGLSAHVAMGKDVFIAGDAGNLSHVLKAVKDMGFKRPVLLADNDIGSKGNTGVFSALKASKGNGARIFVAQLDGVKCDFNDVLLAKGVDAVRNQLIFRYNQNELVPDKNVFEGALQLLRVCQTAVLKKHVWIACTNAISNQFLLDLDAAELAIVDVLAGRGVDKDAALADVKRVMGKALLYAVRRCKSKNAGGFVGFSEVVDCIGRNNASLAAQILKHKGIWLDNRPMGTGKTELMGALLGLGVAQGYTMSYLCHRQSLVANSSERIKAISYKTIESSKDLADEQAIALCVNSIINPRFSKYVTEFSNILCIDEIRQTLEHVAIGSVTASERKSVHDALIAAIKNADYVLGSDADLNQLTIDWLKHTFPDKQFYGLTCQATTPKPIIEYGHYVPVFNAAVASALSGVPTLIQCDSIKASKAVFEAVNRPHLKILLVHGKNKAGVSTDEVEHLQSKFLLNPNEEIKRYDVVIHSPVIGTGISITSDHIKAHFALFRGVLAENEVIQMIGRNRRSEKIIVGFNDKHIKNRVNNAKTLFSGEEIGRARIVDGELVIDALDKLRMKITARHNDSLNDVAVQSLLLMRVKGYQLRRFEGNEDNSTLSVARKQARAVHCDGVLGSDDITALDAYKLEKAESITQQESYCLERYNIVYELALPSTNDGKPDINADDVVFFDGGRVVKVIHNREIANATHEQRLQVDVNTKGFKSVSKGFHIDVLRMVMNERVMDQKHATFVMQYLEKNHAEIAACGLGNYAKPSKYPIRVVNQFLEHFGFKLIGKKISHGERKGDRVYRLCSDERIDAIVERRTVQNIYKAVADGAIDNNTNDTVVCDEC